MATSPPAELPSDKNVYGRSPSPKKPTYTMAFEEEPPLPEAGDFVFVESPNAKTRAAAAQREIRAKERGLSQGDSSWDLAPPVATNGNAVETLQDTPVKNGTTHGHGTTMNGSTSSSSGGLTGRQKRVKNLPTPPVMPVLPDFDDLLATRTMSRTDRYDSGEVVKRKPSIVKKLKDRIK
jgi:hypothetical protein